MTNIETVKTLIKRKQQNMENTINTDADVEVTGEHDTEDINVSENYISSVNILMLLKGA